MKTLFIRHGENPDKIVSILKNKGIIIYPAETCYGIGTDMTNEECIKRLFEIKKRPSEKKISAAVSSLKMAKEYFELSEDAEKLVKAFMPGPLTIITKGKSFRIPADKFIIEIIEKFGKPITATSANVSGQEPIYNFDELLNTFSGNVDLIINGGNLEKNKPSTIFNVDAKKIVREGKISEEEIIKIIS